MYDLIYRGKLIEKIRNSYNNGVWSLNTVINEIKNANSYENEEYEWCHGCKEYDKERYCCPRFNKVIRSTVEEIHNNKWNPIDEKLPEKSGMYICTMDEEYDRFLDRDASPIAFRYFNVEQGSFGFWVKKSRLI